jgi:hypothetical protein
MATIKNLIVEYITDKYRTTKVYKCSTIEIREALTKNPQYLGTRSTVSPTISALKRDGILTELDEKVSREGKGGTPSYYFTLTSILEEVTNPSNQKEEKNVANDKVPAQPKQPPITVATNPFDKVNSQLGELLSKVNGLATGYSQSVELLQAIRSALTQEESHTLNAITDLKNTLDPNPFIEGVRELTKSGNFPSLVDADAINDRLQDLSRDNSFIHAVRMEMDDRIHKTEERLTNEVTKIIHTLNALPVPSSVANTDDYRAGIKEGIKLAVEMGLMTKSQNEW